MVRTAGQCRTVRKALLAPLLLLLPVPAGAHELRPAYLELREGDAGSFHVSWKTPMRGERRLALSPEFSGEVEASSPIVTRASGGAAVQSWSARAVEPLRGQTLRIAGLEATMTDALVRIEFADGAEWTRRLTPREPAAVIPEQTSRAAVAGVYLGLGVEHILLGVDHLLFVLALLLVTRGGPKLIGAVTAFTAAHSLTLGLATLGFVHVPAPPIEAIIAASIVLVAAEIVRSRGGHDGLTARAPWVVAFAFGLLHGFGFAGALGEIGLPEGRIPAALLFFNLGVEAGQLAFLAAVLVAAVAVRRLAGAPPRWMELVPPYAIGILATFWVIQRVAAF